MAPPQHPFPVGALEQRVQYHTVDFKEKSRKLGDFDLKRDCTLLELVQYSCTTPEEQTERLIANPHADIGMECHPFVRLFRKCEKNGKVFHVETTAWEGEHAWKQPPNSRPTAGMSNKADDESTTNAIARYATYFWSPK
ncbi:uncharacterized protein PV06_04335 [Exophiala oligosperma]|uniref:Uncharacterized protein n=2 Tax=Chaetothyriales TaxID=34395 RepID=A0A0D2E5X2_9EURO|nr:uncharacterized protein PV06_04335 [Exophiala oligosperma]KAJ9621054.1 hypothetical protein H2204_012035 [Knufia peltigerae]KIW43209.1 hypothetical protein PV06_04335 [Exophiala oligosperma]